METYTLSVDQERGHFFCEHDVINDECLSATCELDVKYANSIIHSMFNQTNFGEFDFNDIATSHFNMYAHSIVINNLSIQLFLLIILLVFIGFLWKKRSKKE